MGQLTDPFIDGRGDAAGSMPGGASSNVADGSATRRLFGTAAGADYWFAAYTLAGFALVGGGANCSVVIGGTGRSDLLLADAATVAERGRTPGVVSFTNGPASSC